MYCAQPITQPMRIPNTNNFYCNKKLLFSINSNYRKLSEVGSIASKEDLAFALPDSSFIPLNIIKSFQEAIVISTIHDSNIFADATNNWIKKHKNKNHHSLFYKEIFKALLTKKIEVIDSQIELKKIDNKIILAQKYIWTKSWKQPPFLPGLHIKKTTIVPGSSKKFIMDQLSSSPVFVVKNGFNEIILGHPLSRIKRGPLKQAAFSFSSLLNYSKVNGPISRGLFFFHPDDATEFKNFVQSIAPSASKHMEVRVEPIGLHVAYKMNRDLHGDTQFRFIPDFKEVGDLIFKHRKSKNLIFHKNQYYGKTFFQGQPIYIIQPINVKNRNGQISTIKFSGLNDDREVIFTNLEAANKSWTNFIKTQSSLQSIKKPTLLVYNLESFLKDKELLRKEDLTKFVVVTNKDAYIETKESMALLDSNSLYKHLKLNMKPKLFFVKLWIKRLISTLTYE
uniref:hypothetical protein n=1 Tax=Bangia atropurpurea TaxID=31347 RepID=UPI001FCDAA80|nr:hypothetical protein MW410_pgp140 [Bangia atropurpurea]UNJ18240.1 hypothetical protein [Bangia atropurpurea]